jgi:hypothetical protein
VGIFRQLVLAWRVIGTSALQLSVMAGSVMVVAAAPGVALKHQFMVPSPVFVL